jgi:hypothetical protein
MVSDRGQVRLGDPASLTSFASVQSLELPRLGVKVFAFLVPLVPDTANSFFREMRVFTFGFRLFGPRI